MIQEHYDFYKFESMNNVAIQQQSFLEIFRSNIIKSSCDMTVPIHFNNSVLSAIKSNVYP